MKRLFSQTARNAARKRVPTDIKLRAPIPPTINNIEVSDSHPLWQFFDNKNFLRQPAEIQSSGRSWSIPELRRKSFNDLHCLWYVCLRERNVLAREGRLLNSLDANSQQLYEEQSDKVRQTMWRIKHVLSERQYSFENAQKEFKKSKKAYLSEVQQAFLESTPEEMVSSEWSNKLERLQYAFFGIPDTLSNDIVVDLSYLEGIKFIAEMKFGKLSVEYPDILASLPGGKLRDIAEVYSIFEEAPSSDGFQSAVDKIIEYRESNIVIPKSKEMEVVQEFIADRVRSVEQSYVEQSQREISENI